MDNRGYIALAIIFVVIALTLLRSSNVGLVDWYDDGTAIGQRSGQNLLSGDGITVSGVDDPTNSRVNVTVATNAASGGATVNAASTMATVAHGFGTTPDRVIISPTSNWEGTEWWVSSKGAINFTISLSNSTSSSITFDWRAFADE